MFKVWKGLCSKNGEFQQLLGDCKTNPDHYSLWSLPMISEIMQVQIFSLNTIIGTKSRVNSDFRVLVIKEIRNEEQEIHYT